MPCREAGAKTTNSMVVSAMTVVGGTKVILWTGALVFTNLLTAAIFSVTYRSYSGREGNCRIIIVLCKNSDNSRGLVANDVTLPF